MERTLTSLIPAGGEGTRLMPHTLLQQKPMLLMGSPKRHLIDFALALSEEADHTYVTTNYKEDKSEAIEGYVLQNKGIRVLRDIRPIGAASLIDHYKYFSQEDPEGDIVILPSDLVYKDISIKDFYDYHKRMDTNITLLTVQPKNYGEYVVVEKGLAKKIVKNPVSGSLSTTGIYIFKNKYLIGWMKKELDNGWDGESRSMYRDIICPAVLTSKVAACFLNNNQYWDDAGTLQRYYSNNMIFSNNRNVISREAVIRQGVDIRKSVVLGDPLLEGEIVIENSIVSGSGQNISITQIE